MFKVLCILLLSVHLFSSDLEEGKAYKELVIGYAHGLIKASQKSKFEHLEKYLTKDIRLKTRVWIESYHFSDIFMDALFLGTRFSNLKTAQYTASIESKEKWKYRYINTKTNEILVEPMEVDYHLRYYFILLEDGTWKINHIKILKETTKPIKAKQ